MGKQEFLDRLRTALNGRVSPSLVQENVLYYEDYINTEIRKGKREEEVLSALGDARLIAKTIIETNKQDGQNVVEGNWQEAGAWEEEDGDNRSNKRGRGILRIPGWVWLIVLILIIAAVISVVFSVVTVLLPIVLPIILVIFLVKLFRDWLK